MNRQPDRSDRKEELIALGKELIFENQLKKHSILNLFTSTVKFISIKTWILQLVLLCVTVFIVLFKINGSSSLYNLVGIYTTILLLSVALFLQEIFKSFSYGVWELEQTLKYDIRQLLLAKFVILTFIDAVLVFLLSLVTEKVIGVSLVTILVYLLVPLNLIFIALMAMITYYRRKVTHSVKNMLLSVLVISYFFCSVVFDVYSIKFQYWQITFVLTTIIFTASLLQQLIKLKRGSL